MVGTITSTSEANMQTYTCTNMHERTYVCTYVRMYRYIVVLRYIKICSINQIIMGQIILNGSMDRELLKILATMCINLQKEFDISPETLNHLINEDQFIRYCSFLHRQCNAEMFQQLKRFKLQFKTDENSISIDDTDAYERCGFLKTSRTNNYVTYCNAHRYLHPHPTLKLIPKNEIDHPFVPKNHNQIVKEKYNNMIHHIYQSYINKVYVMIHKLFIESIIVRYQQNNIEVATHEFAKLVNNMRHNRSIFKTRSIYEYREFDHKYYYVKTYDVSRCVQAE